MSKKQFVMMRTFMLFLILSVVQGVAVAQKTIKDVLNTMPEKIIPYLDNEKRAEIFRYNEVKDSIKVKNLFNGTTSLDTLSADFLKMSLNENTELQLRLLPYKDSAQVICMVKTVKKPVPESVVRFYSDNWSEIDSCFNLPDTGNAESLLELFTVRPDTMSVERYNELCNWIEPVMVYVSMDDDSGLMTYELGLPMLSRENKAEVLGILKKNRFKWDGFMFKKY